MKIRMLHQRTGGRYDGQAWPERGAEFNVPDAEAAWLCAEGYAEPVEPPAPRTPKPKAKPAAG